MRESRKIVADALSKLDGVDTCQLLYETVINRSDIAPDDIAQLGMRMQKHAWAREFNGR